MFRNFFQQGMIFLENDKNWFSFVFTVLPKHIKIKSPLKYDSVCGRAVKPSGLSSALSSFYRSITGSSLNGARFTIFFPVILNCIVLSPSFSLLIYYISLYHIILLPLLTDLGFA